jgi:SAM-dependent methyltransferase
MSTFKEWPHAHVNPRISAAFFDGIVIRSDSLYNSRPDRVLPIFEEEQILMCRLMATKLKSGMLVLDVGTGSGVFGIYAAKLGCRVVAIDQSPRACKFAISNAEINNVEIATNVADLFGEEQRSGETKRHKKSGAIYVGEEIFAHDFCQTQLFRDIERFNQGEFFDAVLLSPPYTMSPPKERLENIVAVHAAAGTDGMEEFRKQMSVVPRVLRDGGICFGNQMSVIRPLRKPLSDGLKLLRDRSQREQVELIKVIRESFSGSFEIDCVPILHELQDTREFLRKQFYGVERQLSVRNIKDSTASFEQSREEDDAIRLASLRRWQEAIAKEFPSLSFLYYSTRKGGEGRIKASGAQFVRKDGKPLTDWDHRIRIHKATVEHKIRGNFTPLPVFVTSGASDPLLTFEGALGVDKEGFQRNRILERNPLALIDAEISSQNFSDLFSVIYIDSTPNHPTPSGHYQMKLERRVWIDGVAHRTELMRKGLEEVALADAVLKNWQDITMALQDAKCGVGLHHAFVKLLSPNDRWRWPEIVTSDYPCRVKGIREIAREIVDHDFKEALKRIEAREFKPESKFTQDEENFYSYSSLEDVKAGSYQENRNAFDKRASRIRQEAEGILRRYEGSSEWEVNEEISRADLFACHLSMHNLVQKQFMEDVEGIYRNRPRYFPKESRLYSIPLGMIFYQREQDKLEKADRDFPPYYKGGLWAWFVPKDDSRVGHEDAANHLMQMLWVLLTASNSALSEIGREREAKFSVTESFAHEVKKVAGALTAKMIHPADKLFNFGGPESPAGTISKLGEINLSPVVASLVRPVDVGITFFHSNVVSTGELINLWCQAANPSDARGVVGEGIEDTESLVRSCWKTAVDALLIYALAREIDISGNRAVKGLQDAKNIEESIKCLFGDNPNVEVDCKDLPKMNWKAESDHTAWLVRLLLALLNNCAAHGDPSSIPRVKFTRLYGDNDYSHKLTIANKLRRRSAEQSNEAILSEILDSLLEKNPALDVSNARRGLKWLATAKWNIQGMRKGKFTSREVVASCAAQLRGKLVRWPPEEAPTLSDCDDFIVEVNFNYGGNAPHE